MAGTACIQKQQDSSSSKQQNMADLLSSPAIHLVGESSPCSCSKDAYTPATLPR
jgi:hypothetical protein